MNKHNQRGSVNSLLLPCIVITLLFFSSAGFGVWAFAGRQDYKDNTDAKIASAVTVAQQAESTVKDRQFAEIEKQPLRTYTGPQAFGSLLVKYPKTWSAYVDDTGTGNAQIDAYFNPGTVPALTAQNSLFALRVQVIAQSYSSTVDSIRESQQGTGAVVTPFALAKVPNIIGVRVDGNFKEQKNGSLIILPLRDKTIEISTESSDFLADFNKNILPNFSFSP